MSAVPMLAGVGLLSACCISSAFATGMMGGGEETPKDSTTNDSTETDNSCDETMSGEKDEGYRGCQTKTFSGKTCQNWTSQSPHEHNKVLGEKGVGDHNYCRNPDGEDTIWCYTTDPSKRWEFCNPIGERECDETMSGEKDEGYRGCQTKTRSGKTCQSWNVQTPHKHTRKNEAKGTVGHNYCRNPDGEDTIWCYTTDTSKRWEYCDPL